MQVCVCMCVWGVSAISIVLIVFKAGAGDSADPKNIGFSLFGVHDGVMGV